MIIQAELKCKQTGCEADPCAVDKVIELPSQRFQQFSHALLADYDFIAENKNAIRHDDDSRHCLLILDAEGKDGFLVDPQGYNYARYSAFVPNARSLLTPDMGIDRSYLSPAEPWRDESMMMCTTLCGRAMPQAGIRTVQADGTRAWIPATCTVSWHPRLGWRTPAVDIRRFQMGMWNIPSLA